MPILFHCDYCGKALKVRKANAGRSTMCPGCSSVIQIPGGPSPDEEPELAELAEDQADDSTSQSSRRSGTASKAKPRRKFQPDEPVVEYAPARKRNSKKSSKLATANGTPVWMIAAGIGFMGLLSIGAIAVVVMNLKHILPQRGTGDAKPQYQMAETNSGNAKFKMKWEMPAGWTQESEIERGMFPWFHMKGQGQSIKLATMRSLTETASTMTTIGGLEDRLIAAHSFRIGKLQAENTDYVETTPEIYRGKNSIVAWCNFEYKGIFGKAYGIRCTILGAILPCSVTMECSQSSRDRWHPVILRIADSVTFISLENDGKGAEGMGGNVIDGGPAVDAPADDAERNDAAENDPPAADNEN